MFENMDFTKMGELLNKAQEKANELEQEALKKEFCAKSGGGLVKVCANGKGEIIDVDIDDSLLDDKESMQILLIAAINDVQKMVEQDKKSMASNLFSKMGVL